jgi:hypothetical protein
MTVQSVALRAIKGNVITQSIGHERGKTVPSISKRNLEALLESTKCDVWSVDLNYRLTAFNTVHAESAERNFGLRLAVGMGPEEYMPPERAAILHELFARTMAG